MRCHPSSQVHAAIKDKVFFILDLLPRLSDGEKLELDKESALQGKNADAAVTVHTLHSP